MNSIVYSLFKKGVFFSLIVFLNSIHLSTNQGIRNNALKYQLKDHVMRSGNFF